MNQKEPIPRRAAARPSRASGSSDDRRGAWLTVISGERRGLVAAAERGGLAVLAALYRAGLAAHNLRLRLPGAVRRAPCPVVSVGNLTVGGTGKTPMVAHLARLATSLGLRPLIVSRGYGAAAGGPNEEARELETLSPGVPHVQSPDRLGAIRRWTADHPCDLVILDDGFQHRRLARDLDIVLVDALHPFGLGPSDFGRLLPRGILREPLSALARADLAILTRVDPSSDLGHLTDLLACYLRPGTPILTARHRPTGLRMLDGSRREADWLRGQDVAAACGIGNPDAFRRTLEQQGARVRLFEVFPDHYAYTGADLDRLIQAARAADAKMLVTTGKDFVKWRPLIAGSPPPMDVAALEVTFQILEGEDVLRRRIAALRPLEADSGRT
jgi:tetraacyldisaccharide 4'-kinase